MAQVEGREMDGQAARQDQRTQAQQHLQAAQLVAKQLARRVTSERVRVWAYHMRMMLASKD